MSLILFFSYQASMGLPLISRSSQPDGSQSIQELGADSISLRRGQQNDSLPKYHDIEGGPRIRPRSQLERGLPKYLL
jgi:hypothetical protein